MMRQRETDSRLLYDEANMTGLFCAPNQSEWEREGEEVGDEDE